MKSLSEVELKKSMEAADVKKYSALKVKTALYTSILKKSFHMVTEYKALIKHTGGLLTASMGFAYAKGINDTLKLIAKENIDEIMAKEENEASAARNSGDPAGIPTSNGTSG